MEQVREKIKECEESEATELSLSYNRLTKVPEELSQLTALTWLDLSHNQLTEVPKELNQLTALTRLDLSYNRLTEVSKELSQLKALTTLDLSGNRLTEVSKELSQLKALTTLNLFGNQLTEVSKELSQLTALTTLNLSYNQLTVVFEELSQFTALTTLDLSGNRLTEVSKELSQLKALTTLNLSYNQLTVVSKELSQLKALTRLNLSRNRLTELPTELSQLTALTTLNLSGNQLTEVSKELSQLTALTTLDLSLNQLTEVSKELSQLKALTTLDLSDNRLTVVFEELSQLTALTTLDLSLNQLTEVPKELSQLKALTTLNLSRNRLTEVPKELSQFTALTTLDLFGNRLTVVSKELSQLTALTTLNLSLNQLTEVSKELSQLKALTTLNLSYNQLTVVPKELSQLKALTTLNLSGNQLTEVPKELSQLKALTTLNLSCNGLTEVFEELSQLTALTTLNLSGNQLTEVPKQLSQLKALTTLDLSGNQLTEVPKELSQLTALTTLDLSGNRLTEVSKELSQLKALTTLNLSYNQLTELPTELSQLTALTTLNLSRNQLTEVSKELSQLTALTRLNLSRNRLTEVPKELSQLTALTELDLAANELIRLPSEIGNLRLRSFGLTNNDSLIHPPPEVVRRGVHVILAYLREAFNPVPAYRCKILVMGEGNVGKTCLVRYLIDQSYDPKSLKTDGIEVVEWTNVQLAAELIGNISIWDFGGQEVYLNTHQLFFTDRCLYLLVWNGRERVETAAIRWLQQLAARVPSANILVVATQRDIGVKLSASQVMIPRHRLGMADLSSLTVHPDEPWVSSLDGTHFDKLRETLFRELLLLPKMGALYPADWVAVAERLPNIREKHPGPIDVNAFLTMMKQEFEADSYNPAFVLVPLMIETLHDWGVIVRYRRRERTFVIVEPQWVHNRFAEVVGDKSASLGPQPGIVMEERMCELEGWCGMDSAARNDVMALLEQSEVMFEVYTDTLDVDGVPTSKRRWLVPAMLPVSRPAEFGERMNRVPRGDLVVHRVALSFVPTGLFAWLVVRLREKTSVTDVDSVRCLYANGIELMDQRTHTYGTVHIEPMQSFVMVRTRGSDPHGLAYHVSEVLDFLAAKRFSGLFLSHYVHCPSVECAQLDDLTESDFYFSRKRIDNALARRKPTLECNQCGTAICLNQLIAANSTEAVEFPSAHTEQDVILATYERVAERYYERMKHDTERNVESIREAIDTRATQSDEANALQFQRLEQMARRTFRTLLSFDARTPRIFYLTTHSKPPLLTRFNPTSNAFLLHLCCEYEGGTHEQKTYTVSLRKKKLRKIARALDSVIKWTKPLIQAGVRVGTTATGHVEAVAPAVAATGILCDSLRELLQDDSSYARLTKIADEMSDDETEHVKAEIGSDLHREVEDFILAQGDHREWGLTRATLMDGRVCFLCEKHLPLVSHFTEDGPILFN